MSARTALGITVAAATALASLLIAVVPAAPVRALGGTRFGVMLGGNDVESLERATSLNSQVVRKLVTITTWSGGCSICYKWTDAGIGTVLTVRHNGGATSPSSPVTDEAGYKAKLGEIITAYQPEVIVVENEENALNFYSGSPAQYHSTLEAACEVAHSRGILCANGGLTNPTVIAMTYLGYVDAGQGTKADSYARRVSLTDEEYEDLVDPWMEPWIRDRAERGHSFLNGYKAAGVDYVNFHWYREDPQAFGETIEYLESQSRLPAMSNEIGQYDDSRTTINGLMQEASLRGIDYAIWYSIDYTVPSGYTTRALTNPDSTLRPHGDAFRSFLAGTSTYNRKIMLKRPVAPKVDGRPQKDGTAGRNKTLEQTARTDRNSTAEKSVDKGSQTSKSSGEGTTLPTGADSAESPRGSGFQPVVLTKPYI